MGARPAENKFILYELVRSLQRACAAVEINAESVLIAATHMHVAPCTTERIVGQPAPAFLARLEEATVQAVGRAIDDLEETELLGAFERKRADMERTINACGREMGCARFLLGKNRSLVVLDLSCF